MKKAAEQVEEAMTARAGVAHVIGVDHRAYAHLWSDLLLLRSLPRP
jgi:hypothetical protein